MIILAEKLDFFCARISNIRSKTLFWAQNSNQPICNLSTHYVICLLHPDSRHIAQAADYLRISKPPLIDILETWIFRRLGYSGGLDIREACNGYD